MTAPPLCTGCSVPIPWDDVDRGSGRCRQCGVAFDFSIPAAKTLPQAQIEATQAPPEIVPIPPLPVAKPHGVSVVGQAASPSRGGAYRSGARVPLETLDVSWRQLRWGGIAIIVLFVFVCVSVVVHNGRGQPLPMTIVGACIFFGGLGAIVRSIVRIRARVLVSDADVVVEQQKMYGRYEARIAFADVATFRCQRGTVRGGKTGDVDMGTPAYDVCAVLNDGRTARVVAEIADPSIAVYVTQLLAARLRPS
ncbi:MAG TPA: hypothetical protein VIF62_00530 [Labilithrix sp.]|jgi:hypothetical protein